MKKSPKRETLRKEFVRRWEELVLMYQEAKRNPALGLIIKILKKTASIFFELLVIKALEPFFK